MYQIKKTQGLRRELTEEIDETQVDLQAVKTSIDTRAKNLQETLADAMNDLHEQPGLMLLVEAQKMKAEIRNSQEILKRNLMLPDAGQGCVRATGTGVGAAKPTTFDRSTSWAVFQRQFKTVTEHKCWTCLEKYTYLITALQGRATDVLHRVPKGPTYEETLEAL
jgi:hypothetical protein